MRWLALLLNVSLLLRKSTLLVGFSLRRSSRGTGDEVASCSLGLLLRFLCWLGVRGTGRAGQAAAGTRAHTQVRPYMDSMLAL